MHHLSGPDDAWSTINTRENYQGVMSPLGATLWLPISDLAVNGTFPDLGVLRRDEIRVEATPGEATSAVFYGRYTAGINYFRRVSDLIPGTSGAAFEEQIFGSVRPGAPGGGSRLSGMRRYPVVAVKAPLTVARLPRRLREMTGRLDRWWRFATSPDGLARPVPEQFREAFAMLEYAMRMHVTGTFVAQGVFDALARLAAGAGRPGLHLELSGGYGQMVELELVAALDRVALGELDLAGFLADYGFRCAGEVEMSNPSWRERPELVERLVAKYRAAGERPDPAAAAAARTAARRAAEAELLAALPGAKRPVARLLRAAGRREAAGRRAPRAAGGLRAAGRAGRLDRPAGAGGDHRARSGRRGRSGPGHRGGRDRGRARRGRGCRPGAASAEECDDLEPDEILVCRTTDPSWASAFHLAAGAVIDIGSTSSHGAIVAR